MLTGYTNGFVAGVCDPGRTMLTGLTEAGYTNGFVAGVCDPGRAMLTGLTEAGYTTYRPSFSQCPWSCSPRNTGALASPRAMM